MGAGSVHRNDSLGIRFSKVDKLLHPTPQVVATEMDIVAFQNDGSL